MPCFITIFVFILIVFIPDKGIKKTGGRRNLPAGLKFGSSSIDLTLSDSYSWHEPEKDKINLGESVLY